VNENVTRDHYARLAATYDENWAHSPAYLEWMTRCIRQQLDLTGTDLVADIGCGTGLYSRRLAEHAQVVVCAEPSAQMLAEVPRDDRLIPVAASAEDLATGRVKLPHNGYDAVLLKEVLHHVADRAGVVAGLTRLLRPGGRMLVVMLPTEISYPLFAAALRAFTDQQPDPANIARDMRDAGLRAEVALLGFPLRFKTERYLQMVRSRYMSLLSMFDDEELEAGVAEIRRAHPEDEVEFTDTFAFVRGTAT
jgi:SAM-dependent methyltransferase